MDLKKIISLLILPIVVCECFINPFFLFKFGKGRRLGYNHIPPECCYYLMRPNRPMFPDNYDSWGNMGDFDHFKPIPASYQNQPPASYHPTPSYQPPRPFQTDQYPPYFPNYYNTGFDDPETSSYLKPYQSVNIDQKIEQIKEKVKPEKQVYSKPNFNQY